MQNKNFRLYLFYIGIFITIIGMPFSRALVSFGQIIFAIIFLFDKNLISKTKRFFTNKINLAFISFYILLCLGMLYTKNYEYGFKDLRTKIPMLLFPLVFFTEKKLNPKTLRNFLLLFAAAVTLSTSYSLILYLSNSTIEYRAAFPFVSHIRLSIEIVISISVLLYYSFKNKDTLPTKSAILFIIVSIYLAFALITMELLSGIIILLAGIVFYSIKSIKNNISIFSSTQLIVFITILFISILGFSYYSFKKYRTPYQDKNNLEQYSQSGNKYSNKISNYPIENGSYIGAYIQIYELRKNWNLRSTFDFDGNDLKTQKIQNTIIRYLNSKHLKKDSSGIWKLTNQDIKYIQAGFANIEYTKKFSLNKRLYKLFWEYYQYKEGGDCKGHTLFQRIELWKTGLEIIKQNLFFGVGTGDINDEFQKEFQKNDSSLIDSGLKSHNQYISISVTLGVFGLIVFLFSIIYPISKTYITINPLFIYFFIFISISMMWEDTIETQIGVTIFSFFYSLFLYSKSQKID